MKTAGEFCRIRASRAKEHAERADTQELRRFWEAEEASWMQEALFHEAVAERDATSLQDRPAAQ
jgi:hypothetical protein